MNEAGGERTGLKEQVAGAAKSLVDKVRRGFGGDNAQQPPNLADGAAAEAALDMDAAEAAATLTELFPDKFSTPDAAKQAVADIGASINRDRRADFARAQKMSEITDLLNQMPGAGQDSDIEDILDLMERRSQEQKGKKP